MEPSSSKVGRFMSLYRRQYLEPDAVRWLKLIGIEERRKNKTSFAIATPVVWAPLPIKVGNGAIILGVTKGTSNYVFMKMCSF